MPVKDRWCYNVVTSVEQILQQKDKQLSKGLFTLNGFWPVSVITTVEA